MIECYQIGRHGSRVVLLSDTFIDELRVYGSINQGYTEVSIETKSDSLDLPLERHEVDSMVIRGSQLPAPAPVSAVGVPSLEDDYPSTESSQSSACGESEQTDAPAHLLNTAADLLTDEMFIEYEQFKKQYPQYKFATDARSCYRRWINTFAPCDSDSALADTPMAVCAAPQAIEDAPAGECATFTPQAEPMAAQDRLPIAGSLQVAGRGIGGGIDGLRQEVSSLYKNLYSTPVETRRREAGAIMGRIRRLEDEIKNKEGYYYRRSVPGIPRQVSTQDTTGRLKRYQKRIKL
jgi:hypothetical protein